MRLFIYAIRIFFNILKKSQHPVLLKSFYFKLKSYCKSSSSLQNFLKFKFNLVK